MESSIPASAMQEESQDEYCSASRASLSSLPPEILSDIFCHLSTLSETLDFAAAFGRSYHVLKENGDPIIRALAPRTLLCPREALQLLTDQDEPSRGASAAGKRPIARLLRNQRAVENAAARFEEVIVKHVKCPAFDTHKVYGCQPRPKWLTSSERQRFTRAYYQLESLLCLGEKRWDSRLACFSNLRHLYYLHEICALPSCIHSGTPQDDRKWQRRVPSDTVRERLQSAVWRRIDEIYYETFGRKAEEVEDYAIEDGYMGYVTLWDHWQDSLQQVICRLKPTDLGKQAGLDRPDLWVGDEG